MIYHSIYSHWTVGQRKSLEFYYNTKFIINTSPNTTIDKVTSSLRRIGPTILAEWEE